MATKKTGPKKKKFGDRYPGATPVEQPADWTEWTEEGQEIVGTLRGLSEFRNGWKADVDTDEGPVLFSVPSMLLGLLKRIEHGTSIAIVYTGEKPGPAAAGKNPVKEFEVYVLET